MILASCGFSPVYKADNSPALNRDRPLIQVNPIKDRLGQLLRNHLQNRLNPRGHSHAPSYILDVSLNESQASLALKKSAISTRANLSITANFHLVGTKHNLGQNFSATAKITTSYNLLNSKFASLVAEQDARKQGVKAVGEMIATRIKAFIKQSTTLR